MVLSVLALAALIFVTPDILGRPSPELASLPLLIIGMTRNESAFIVNVGPAVQAYRYDRVRLDLNGTDPAMNRSLNQTDSYGLDARVPVDGTLNVHVFLVDQLGNYFEYNVSGRVEKDADDRTVMVFWFPYEKDMTQEFRRVPPDDFRWVIPRRGTLP